MIKKIEDFMVEGAEFEEYISCTNCCMERGSEECLRTMTDESLSADVSGCGEVV